MRELLKRWAELEPGRCSIKTLPDNLEEFFVTYDDGTFIVFTSTNVGDHYWQTKSESLMRIQWAVQEATIKREWYFNLSFHPLRAGYRAEVGGKRKWAEESTEAFLSAYLAALEVFTDDN